MQVMQSCLHVLLRCALAPSGYIIPDSVVSHFLREYDLHGTFRGCCSVGFRWQDMENNSLKEHFKVLVLTYMCRPHGDNALSCSYVLDSCQQSAGKG